MQQPQREDRKEIRLFGEKSLRERAYRDKILQLEKEVAHLEALAKSLNYSDLKEEKISEDLDGLYYDSLLTFDKRVKKEREIFERRATELSEKLDHQAQRLLFAIESYHKNKIKWLTIYALAAILPVIVIAVVAKMYLSGHGVQTPGAPVSISGKQLNYDTGLSRLKTALQTQTKYRHQYDVSYLDLIDGSYHIEIELNFLPQSKWVLKNICEEVVGVFHKYAKFCPVEISFQYGNMIYLKAYLSKSSPNPQLKYFY